MNPYSGAPHYRCQLVRCEAHWKGAFARLAAAALVATALSSVSFGQRELSFTVRVLNAKSGKPLKGVLVEIYGPTWIQKEGRREQAPLLAYARTGGDGVAVVELRAPIPEIVISYGDWLSVGGCTPTLPFATAEILRTGVVGANDCSGSKFEYKATPKPGELVIFGKKWSWWERMKHSE